MTELDWLYKMNEFLLLISTPENDPFPMAQIYYKEVLWVEVRWIENQFQVKHSAEIKELDIKIPLDKGLHEIERAKKALEVTINTFSIVLASPPDKEYLVAEISYNGVFWAEINRETKNLMVEMYGPPDKEYRDLPLDGSLDQIRNAAKALQY